MGRVALTFRDTDVHTWLSGGAGPQDLAVGATSLWAGPQAPGRAPGRGLSTLGWAVQLTG